MTVMERIVSSGQLTALSFHQANVAASQSDVQLSVCAVDNAGDDQLGIDGYVMPAPGEIFAITGRLSAAATAGTLTIGPTIDGTEKTALTQTVTTGQSPRGTIQRETSSMQFAAGALIGAEITTNAAWNGTGADLTVTVWVVLQLKDSGY